MLAFFWHLSDHFLIPPFPADLLSYTLLHPVIRRITSVVMEKLSSNAHGGGNDVIGGISVGNRATTL
jgi:hypothetical protein